MAYLKKEDLDSLDLEKYLDIAKELSIIDERDINRELNKHSIDYSYYNGLLIFQKAKLEKLERTFEILKSTLKHDKSLEGKSKGAKYTASFLDDFANQDPNVSEMSLSIVREQEVYGYLKSMCSVLQHKKDMLVQVSANTRSEIKQYS